MICDPNPHPFTGDGVSVLLNPITIAKDELHQVSYTDSEPLVIGGKVWQIEIIRLAPFVLDQIELIAMPVQNWVWVIGCHC